MKVRADIGAMVKTGDLVAQIDPRSYQAALAQAQGQLARDSATMATGRSIFTPLLLKCANAIWPVTSPPMSFGQC